MQPNELVGHPPIAEGAREAGAEHGARASQGQGTGIRMQGGVRWRARANPKPFDERPHPPRNQPTNQSIGMMRDPHSAKQSTNQSVNQSINQGAHPVRTPS